VSKFFTFPMVNSVEALDAFFPVVDVEEPGGTGALAAPTLASSLGVFLFVLVFVLLFAFAFISIS